MTSAPPVVPWHWDWTYADPTCDALTVSYPANLPENQANDVNIRIRTNRGEVTLNYHNNETTWSGTTGFTYSQHPRWPAGVTSYTVTWIQVAGTNYHWQEGLDCRILTDGDPDTLDAPLGVTSIDGYSAGRTRLATGRALPADSVVVDQSGLEAVVLQRQVEGVWHTVRTVATTEGVARVAYPRERRKGTYAYRLLAPRSESVTGVATKAVTVKVVTKAKKRTRH